MNRYPTLDELILKLPAGSLLVPICAKEVYVLRTIGTRWQSVVKTVVAAHGELMAHPAGFGQTDFKLYVTRKYMRDNVISSVGQEIELPQDIFEWPLSK